MLLNSGATQPSKGLLLCACREAKLSLLTLSFMPLSLSFSLAFSSLEASFLLGV